MNDTGDSSAPFAEAFGKPRGSQEFSTVQGLAMLFFVATVVIPAVWYVRADFHGLFANPRMALFAIVVAGGASSMVIIVRKGFRLRGLLTGALMGAGSAGMVLLMNAHFPSVLHINRIGKVILMVAMAIGAFPGLMIWVRISHRKVIPETSKSEAHDPA